MTETCSHPKGALVVPETVVPAFETSILPREESSVIEKPKTIKDYFKKLSGKSLAIVSPAVTVGAFQGYVSVAEAIPNPDFITVAGVTLGTVLLITSGLVGTVTSLSSFVDGDRKFFPLPATKKYLEAEANKKKALITPFNEWDNIFAQNDDRMQKMLTPGK